MFFLFNLFFLKKKSVFTGFLRGFMGFDRLFVIGFTCRPFQSSSGDFVG